LTSLALPLSIQPPAQGTKNAPVSATDVAGAATFRRRYLSSGEETIQASPAYP
jgi:hypothetical protein